MNVGILGSGAIAAAHALGIKGLAASGIKLHGIFDCDQEKALAFSENYGGKVYSSLEAFLDDPELDSVVICLPHGLHCEYAIRCMKAGKNVLVEKPMAPDVEECRKMIACMKETGKILQVGHEYHLYPAIKEARKVVESGVLGEIISIEGHLSSYIYNKLGTWWMDPEKAKGGPAVNMGVHMFDAISYLLRRLPSRVRGEARSLHPDAVEGIEDWFRSELDFGNGLIADCSIYSFLPNGPTAYPAGITVMGTDGYCRFWSNELLLHKKDGEAEIIYKADPSKACETFGEQLKKFSEYVEGSNVPLSTAEYGMWLVACVEAITGREDASAWISLDDITKETTRVFEKISGDWE